ncbi:PhzF family phenazine biosynthesis protein [Azoarcus taiwanensis]|uniref:PhzF family phenazine biosynthesis isomerase n=1 Tax=Azoarcus taiwanensis TaxID=666964 RepID=A0A972FG23_9RHOO|nr:PhzF family phenazine biosynthesis protein [Azoarcus taiwanensis]NMG01681.1 PhzF family phenazine biosynthesis isomerase [Azoarcus taiwanensis]
MNELLRFSQLDVFTDRPLLGNPVAVVHDAEGLDDAEMAAFARWTNLSETTFLLPPTQPGADYRLRIFTPGGELPFAGHPTLGSCRAWLDAGGTPGDGDAVVQECAVGLVRIRRTGERLAFAAPPLRRRGPMEATELAQVAAVLGLSAGEIVAHQWVDNGPGWCAVMLGSAERVLGLQPDWVAMGDLRVGVVAPQPDGADTDFEVRAFIPAMGIREDPVTGSLNAGLAQWMTAAGLSGDRYVARQGTALGRAGNVYVERLGDTIWIGGDVVACVSGSVRLR